MAADQASVQPPESGHNRRKNVGTGAGSQATQLLGAFAWKLLVAAAVAVLTQLVTDLPRLLVALLFVLVLAVGGLFWVLLEPLESMERIRTRRRATLTFVGVAAVGLATWLGIQMAGLLAPDEDQVLSVIDRELNYIVNPNLDALMDMWDPAGLVVDCDRDDYRFEGRGELQERYLRLMDEPWRTVDLVNVTVSVDGDRGVVRHKGTVVNGIYHPHLATYELRKTRGKWLIYRLLINCDRKPS